MSDVSQHWNPYTIPPTPNVGANQRYSLTCGPGAVSTKNPSQFLEWFEIKLPEGSKFGDLLQWDPSAGDGGAWVVLDAPGDEGSIIYWTGSAWSFVTPPSDDTLHVLTIQNGNLAWTATESC
jgi:hypothetical protein